MRTKRTLASGFSLVELLVVVSIIVIILAMSAPRLDSMLKRARLRSNASEVAGLCQMARIQAIKDNQFYEVMLPASTASSQLAFVDLNYDQTYDQGSSTTTSDPAVELAQQVTVYGGTINPPSPPATTSMNLDSSFTPQAQTGGVATNPWFNNRGLPCVPDSATSPTVCTTQIGTVGYIIYFQDTSNDWSAVTILPSGRIRPWTWDGNAWE